MRFAIRRCLSVTYLIRSPHSVPWVFPFDQSMALPNESRDCLSPEPPHAAVADRTCSAKYGNDRSYYHEGNIHIGRPRQQSFSDNFDRPCPCARPTPSLLSAPSHLAPSSYTIFPPPSALSLPALSVCRAWWSVATLTPPFQSRRTETEAAVANGRPTLAVNAVPWPWEGGPNSSQSRWVHHRSWLEREYFVPNIYSATFAPNKENNCHQCIREVEFGCSRIRHAA